MILQGFHDGSHGRIRRNHGSRNSRLAQRFGGDGSDGRNRELSLNLTQLLGAN